jgi:transcriptional regulator with XRE-family HTH domain
VDSPDYIATALQAIRQERGWSLDRASKATGVSKAMLGQIERGESSPTLATLWKLATGFQISLSHLLQPAITLPGGVQLRSADRLRHRPTTDPMLVAPLFPYDPAFGFELLELTLPPGYERLSAPHDAGVTEHVTLIRGQMAVKVGEDWVELHRGDALRFNADQPHGYRCCGSEPAVFHNLIHYRYTR